MALPPYGCGSLLRLLACMLLGHDHMTSLANSVGSIMILTVCHGSYAIMYVCVCV